jgi:hypothetical protein
MQAFHADYYIAQVNNGGHSQYVGNSGWHQYQIDDIRAGLAAIGIEDGIELYEDLCAFADSHPEQFRGGMVTRGFGAFPEFFDKADKLFFAGLDDRLMKGNSEWIRSLDCLLVLEEGQYRKVMTELPGRNPHAAQRGAEAEARAKASLDRDPIVQVCRCLGVLSPPAPANVEALVDHDPRRRPERRERLQCHGRDRRRRHWHGVAVPDLRRAHRAWPRGQEQQGRD